LPELKKKICGRSRFSLSGNHLNAPISSPLLEGIGALWLQAATQNLNREDKPVDDKKFDPKKLAKLNNPERLKDIPPDYIGGKLALERPEVLVEIGAGTGFFSIALQHHYNPVKIYACDISATMIDWMTSNVSPLHPAILPIKCAERAIPLADGIADLLYMINLQHELDDPAATLAESFRLVKPGGTLLIIDWKKQEMKEGPPEKIRCHPEVVAEQLTQAGFGDIALFDELPKHFMVVGKK
jgi:SAM-dependent methyltransferase